MTRRILRPDKLDLDSPGRRDYWVALEHDSIWGDHLIPLTVFVGPEAKEGQRLVSFGSNHGYESDEFGFQAVENPTSVHDLHANILHCLGFDPEKLTYRYAGRDFRLTDVHGNVIREIIA